VYFTTTAGTTTVGVIFALQTLLGLALVGKMTLDRWKDRCNIDG